MTTHFDTPVRAGEVWLPSGDYQVNLEAESGQIVLSNPGGVYKVQALKRGSKMRVGRPTVQLRPVTGEPRHLLIVRTPPALEWVASLQDAPGGERR
jgi:hypothetical protein